MTSVKNHFDELGVMIDCSRNAVMTVPQLKRFFDIIAKMGYNQAMLYMEDTYEIENEKFFGYLRGKYSQRELKDLDDYAYSLGIELIPCVQTLAHLQTIFRWPDFGAINDITNILLVDDPRTYEVIENMMAALRSCFRTRKVNIGMDEAHLIGRGKYMNLHGLCDKTELILKHLNKVVEITKKYDFHAYMWNDMFYRLASGGSYYATDVRFDPSIKAMVPEDVTLVYWDYYHTDKKTYDVMIKNSKTLCDRLSVAGGAWRWSGFTSHNGFSLRTTKAALRSCIQNGVRSYFTTLWGDNGAECSTWAMLPVLCYTACYAQGITKMAEIREKFKEWVGYNFDDFMLLDLPDQVIAGKDRTASDLNGVSNPSKIYLYNDCFLGLFDTTVAENIGKKYTTISKRLRNAAKRTGEYGYLFDTASKLSAVLSLKTEIGVRARKAYESKDMKALDEIILDYKKLIKNTEAFYLAFRNQWYAENKPHGFDVQDIRLGGLITRLKSCRDRLTDYRSGKIDSIPELEETLLPVYKNDARFNIWQSNVTVNPL